MIAIPSAETAVSNMLYENFASKTFHEQNLAPIRKTSRPFAISALLFVIPTLLAVLLSVISYLQCRCILRTSDSSSDSFSRSLLLQTYGIASTKPASDSQNLTTTCVFASPFCVFDTPESHIASISALQAALPLSLLIFPATTSSYWLFPATATFTATLLSPRAFPSSTLLPDEPISSS